MINYFSISLLFLLLIYAAFISWCVIGWRKLKIVHPSPGGFKTLVSVIVPVRNEERNIRDCLRDIINQNYPGEFIEIIVADDHSRDRTEEIVLAVMEENPDHKIVLLKAQTETGYKKQAITDAIQKANGELVITTDADCRMPGSWLASIVSYYEREHPDLIAAPVCFHREKNNFEKFQSLEFTGLIGIGAAAVSNHKPIMCNGANLAYTKNIFHEVGGFTGQPGTVSGDDTQLMLKIAKKDVSKIHFLKSPEAVVYTCPAGSVKELYQQRKRWASKIPGKMSAFTFFIGCIAYLLHLGLLIAFAASLFNPSIVPVFLFIFLLKIIPEYILLRDMNAFFGKRNLLWLFLPAQVFYIIYVSMIGAVSLFGSYSWKGREIKIPAIKLPA